MKCSVLSVLKITRVKNALLHYLTYLCNSSCIHRHCKRQSLIKVSRNILVRSKKSYVVFKPFERKPVKKDFQFVVYVPLDTWSSLKFVPVSWKKSQK